MPERFGSLEDACRVATPLGQEKCGQCKHWLKAPTPAADGKQYGECRESLQVINAPCGDVQARPGMDNAAMLALPVAELTVKELALLFMPRQPTYFYPQLPADFAACGRFVRRLAEV